jgi:hypothetical protein
VLVARGEEQPHCVMRKPGNSLTRGSWPRNNP